MILLLHKILKYFNKEKKNSDKTSSSIKDILPTTDSTNLIKNSNGNELFKSSEVISNTSSQFIASKYGGNNS